MYNEFAQKSQKRLENILYFTLYALLVTPFIAKPGTHNMYYYVNWTKGFLNGDLFELYHVGTYVSQDNLTIPYTPVSLFLIGGMGKLLTTFFGFSDTVFMVAVNLTGILATVFTTLLIMKWSDKHSIHHKYYLLSPAVLLISPILGYEDTISGLFLIIACKRFSQHRYYLFGIFGVLAVMTKQLAAIPIAGLVILLVLTRPGDGLKKFISAAIPTFLLILSPFIVNGTLIDYLKNQFLTSVHTMLTANSSNFPWILSMIYNVSSNGISKGLQSSGFGVVIENPILRITTYGFLGLLVILVILYLSVKLKRSVLPWETQTFIIAYASCLTYYFFSAGVHQNHIFLAIPTLFMILEIREFKYSYAIITMAVILEQLTTYGLGLGNSLGQHFIVRNSMLVNLLSIISILLYSYCFYVLIHYIQKQRSLILAK